MKRARNLIVVIIVIGVGLISCKKDDNEPVPVKKNQFILDQTGYDLEELMHFNYGENMGGSYSITLLMAYGIVKHMTDGEVDSVSGNGQCIDLRINSIDSKKIEGTYLYDKEGNLEGGTFNIGIVGINYDWTKFMGDEYKMNSGKVTVKKVGKLYEIKIDGSVENETLLKVFFLGKLKYWF